MKRVLIINTIGFGYEGISSVIINYLKNMDMEGMELVVVVYEKTQKEIRDELITYVKIEELPQRQQNLFGYIRGLFRILKKKNFDVIHIHGNSGTMAIETVIAKFFRIKKIITHCHNTTCSHPVLNRFLKKIMMCTSDVHMACSAAAGKWMYKKNFVVLNNAIDIEKFAYNEEIRTAYRAALNISDKFVLGHVGHFTEQKNHEFLLRTFQKVHEREKNTILLLLGPKGVLYEDMVTLAEQLKIQDAVMFLGTRKDIYNFYQVMDLFVMPSKWEGLPLAMLEAQMSGLNVLVSDVVTEAAKCTHRTIYKSLDEGIEQWSNQIVSIIQNRDERRYDAKQDLIEHGYDIKLEASNLKKIYTEE